MSTETENPTAFAEEPTACPEEPAAEETADERSEQVEELDEETRARRDAALRMVRKLGDPVLRASAVAVERFDEELRSEAQQMGQLMQDALGVGLAATQVGILHRVLVYKAYEDDPLGVLVNPVLEWESEERESKEEGCLSLPGVHVEVERAIKVRVRAQDTNGKEFVVEEEGLPARVIQHEMDHLEGVLILDRISREARRDAMRALRAAREGDDGERAGSRASSRAAPSAAEDEESPRAAAEEEAEANSSGPAAPVHHASESAASA
jgi:peptide deformylase